jgi:actin-related protein
MEKELEALLPPSMKKTDIKVFAPSNRKYMSWFGCSLFSALDAFLDNCLWKYEYEEGATEDFF